MSVLSLCSGGTNDNEAVTLEKELHQQDLTATEWNCSWQAALE